MQVLALEVNPHSLTTNCGQHIFDALMWAYSKERGWKEIDDLLAATKKHSKERFLASGFSQSPALRYGEENSLLVEVRHRTSKGGTRKIVQNPVLLLNPKESQELGPGFDYVVTISIADRFENIAVHALPDLLELLSDVVPLTSHAHRRK